MRQKWIQFHTATLLVWVIAASVLLYLNIKDMNSTMGDWTLFYGPGRIYPCHCYGWPFYFYKELVDQNIGWCHMWWDLLYADIATAIAALACIGFVAEWILRRRKRSQNQLH